MNTEEVQARLKGGQIMLIYYLHVFFHGLHYSSFA